MDESRLDVATPFVDRVEWLYRTRHSIASTMALLYESLRKPTDPTIPEPASGSTRRVGWPYSVPACYHPSTTLTVAPRRGAKVVTSRSACFCGSQPTARGRVLPNVIERSAPPESGFGQLLCAPSCCRIGSRIRAIEPTARKRTAPKVIVAAKPVRCTPNPARSGPSASPPA